MDDDKGNYDDAFYEVSVTPQRKIYSFLESLANVLIGSGVALCSQLLIFPWFGIHLSIWANLEITAYFTIISVARSYLVRRLFNWLHTHTRWY